MEHASFGFPLNSLALNQQESDAAHTLKKQLAAIVLMEKFPLQARKTFWLHPTYTTLQGLLLLFSELLTGWMNGRYK